MAADEDGRVTPEQWVRTLATALDVEPPTQDELDDLLSLAGTAAHTAERWVAPVSCWMVARAEVSPADGRGVVERLAAAARGSDD
ncbi:MAG: DUF6457 domain-containing protein [Trueperaceae bacterium]|nr:DUF6457 domain-containing protein [Trueperaceae bacterium]